MLITDLQSHLRLKLRNQMAGSDNCHGVQRTGQKRGTRFRVNGYLSSLDLRGSDLDRAEPEVSLILPPNIAVLAGGLFCGFRKFWTCCRAFRLSCSCWSFSDCADVVPPGPGIADPVDPTPNGWPSPAPRWPAWPGFDADKFLLMSAIRHQHLWTY